MEAPHSRAVLAGTDGVLIADGTPETVARVKPPSERLAEPILLGLEAGAALFALDLDEEPDTLGAVGGDRRGVSLRGAGGLLPPPQARPAPLATPLPNWD